jgi:hypothetical protein
MGSLRPLLLVSQHSSNLREWMIRPVTSLAGTDRAQRSEKTHLALTLAAAPAATPTTMERRGARIPREKETIATRLLPRRPPTEKSARKAAPRWLQRRRPDFALLETSGARRWRFRLAYWLPRTPRRPVALRSPSPSSLPAASSTPLRGLRSFHSLFTPSNSMSHLYSNPMYAPCESALSC